MKKEPLAVVNLDECQTGQNETWIEARKVIGKMTSFDPRDRISAAEVVREFSSLLQGLVERTPKTRVPQVRKGALDQLRDSSGSSTDIGWALLKSTKK